MRAGPILVPLDGSEIAEAAVPYAEQLARALQHPITYLGVMPPPEDDLTPNVTEKAIAYVERMRRRSVQDYLDFIAEDSSRACIETSVTVRTGEPAEEILATADRLDAALIVMATHGRGGLERMVVGSVAAHVMRAARCPALFVRPRSEHHNRHKPVTLAHLAVPLDGSPLAEQALRPALELTAAFNARLTLVRVEPWLSPWYGVTGYTPNFSRWENEAAVAATEYLRGVRARLPSSARIDEVLLRGRAPEELEEFVHRQDVDAVVMTTHGRSGVRRAVLGSVADSLVRHGVPAVLVPAGASDEPASAQGDAALLSR